MKRRSFLKNTGTLATITALIPSMGLKAIAENNIPENFQNFILKGFNDEQEESPSLVSDENGNLWMFSLRRMSYPEDKEIVSAFRFNGNKWVETNPVTETKGKYEAPVAACAKNGQPIVAWTAINSDKWSINVSRFNENGFEQPYQFEAKTGKSINPVIIAPHKNRNWIAWENFYNGKLRIYISKYENFNWTKPIVLSKDENSCFDPAIAEAKNGDLYIAYGITDGYHQNIELSIIDGQSFEIKKTVPIAVGGGFENRVNLNTKPALAFDALERLWISYENNRNSTRLADGDNYTGDRCCSILTYQDGKVLQPRESGKWLFSGKNDHRPTFLKDREGRLFIATHCGGNFEDNPFWQYRLSWLDPKDGWAKPVTVLKTSQKGALITPALAFDKNNNIWLSTCIEKIFNHAEPEKHDDILQSRLTELMVCQVSTPILDSKYNSITFDETLVKEHVPDENSISTFSGHPKVDGEQITADGQVYTLVYGNLHEHSESSSCWPAGTDGTLHDDYRFGLFSENYDFVGITDHGYTMNEVYWRKNTRLAEFYNDPPHFVAIPSMEWTLTTGRNKEIGSVFGSGHYNVVFANEEEAKKFVRNRHEIYNKNTPETKN